MSLPKVLVVEDEERWQTTYRKDLSSIAEVISAFTVEEGRQKFAEHPDVSVIVMDACVPGDNPTTPALVREIRNTFSGPMIAASGSADYRKMLQRAGCDFEAAKWDVGKILRTILIPARDKSVPA
jgi:CheY-like chemotaxis protein